MNAVVWRLSRLRSGPATTVAVSRRLLLPAPVRPWSSRSPLSSVRRMSARLITGLVAEFDTVPVTVKVTVAAGGRSTLAVNTCPVRLVPSTAAPPVGTGTPGVGETNAAGIVSRTSAA